MVGDTISVNYAVDPPILKLEKDGSYLEANVGDYIVKGEDAEVWNLSAEFFEEVKMMAIHSTNCIITV